MAESGTRTEVGSVLRSSAVMAAGTLVSRVLGMVRSAVLLWAIAALASGDAFSVANKIPTALYMLIAGGALNAVLVPQITRAARRQDGGDDYVDRLLTLTILILVSITVLLTAAAPWVVRLYSGVSDPAQLELAVAFAFWCLPQIFFYGLYNVVGQVLNARGSFGPFMWAPAANNVVSVAGMLVFVVVAGAGDRPVTAWEPAEIALLAGTATAGVAAQALVLIPALRRIGYRYRPRFGFRGVGLRAASQMAGWSTGALIITQLVFVQTTNVVTRGGQLARAAGNALAPGSTTYDNAYLLFMLPHSLVTVSLVTALFTRMSRNTAAGDLGALRSDLSLGLRTTGVATVPAMAAFLVLGGPIAAVLFPLNGADTTNAIALVTAAMALGLPAWSAQYLLVRVFYALEDARTPFWLQIPISAVTVVANVAALYLMPPELIVVGVSLGMTASNVVAVLLYWWFLRGRTGGMDGYRVLRTYVRLTLASAVAAGACLLVLRLLPDLGGLAGALVALAVGGGVLLAVYVLLLRRMRVAELSDLIDPLLARLPHRSRHDAGRP